VQFGALETLVLTSFWNRRRVLVTGHTGFKGAWLAFWLSEMGAEVSGLALAPDTNPNLHDILALPERGRFVQRISMTARRCAPSSMPRARRWFFIWRPRR
jgi:nucleoside-diphosphate-sugar epimerase